MNSHSTNVFISRWLLRQATLKCVIEYSNRMTFNLPPKSKITRRRKIVRGALWMASAWLLAMGLRAALIVFHGVRIARQSATFPRDYFVGEAQNRLYTVLVFGDSTAAGWGAENVKGTFAYKIAEAIAARNFRVRVVSVAVGGARLKDVLNHQIGSLKSVQPQLVVVSIGANDATHGTSEIEYSNGLKTLFSRLQKCSAQTLLVANTPDLSRDPALPWLFARVSNKRAQRQNQQLNAVLPTVNEQGTPINVIDLYNDGKLVHRRDDDQYAEDLFHPSASGYEVWAQLFIAQWGKSRGLR